MSALSTAERKTIVGLVGADCAAQDESALIEAVLDLRDQLRRARAAEVAE